MNKTPELPAPATDEAPEAFRPNPYQFRILLGLNRLGKHVYAGTVSDAEKARRRKAGKRQRAARKASRS